MADNGISGRRSSYARETSTAFDQHFSRFVGHGLLKLVVAYAYLVQVGVCDFSEAANRVLANALRLGADRLSSAVFDGLVEWIDLELASRVNDPPAKGVLSPGEVEALVRWEV
jgi:hypothetical protein